MAISWTMKGFLVETVAVLVGQVIVLNRTGGGDAATPARAVVVTAAATFTHLGCPIWWSGGKSQKSIQACCLLFFLFSRI